MCLSILKSGTHHNHVLFNCVCVYVNIPPHLYVHTLDMPNMATKEFQFPNHNVGYGVSILNFQAVSRNIHLWPIYIYLHVLCLSSNLIFSQHGNSVLLITPNGPKKPLQVHYTLPKPLGFYIMALQIFNVDNMWEQGNPCLGTELSPLKKWTEVQLQFLIGPGKSLKSSHSYETQREFRGVSSGYREGSHQESPLKK